MTALFGVGAAVLMALSTTLLVWNSHREAESSARGSLNAVSVLLRQPIEKDASLDEIKRILAIHNGRATRNGPWAAEVEAWLISPGGALKWKTGPFLPPRRVDSPYHWGDRSQENGDGHWGNDLEGGPDDGGPDDDASDGSASDDRAFNNNHPNNANHGNIERGKGIGANIGQRKLIPFWARFIVPPREDSTNWRHMEIMRDKDTLILGVPWFRNARTLRSQALTLYCLAFLSSGAAAIGAWFLVGRVLSPIEKLAGQASGLANNDSFEGRLNPTSSDAEMRNLTTTLNAMLGSLGEAARSKERFHTAASHELRTPLQALSGHLQVALSRERGAEEYRAALEEAAQQTERLSSLTRDLLMLNQLQMATSKPPHEMVDVTEIVAQSIDRCAVSLGTRHVKICEELEAWELDAAPSHLEMLSRNLVENAVKYVSDSGEIDIVLREGELVVWNETGVQLEDGDLERLFEPFFRPDVSRHSATGGNGLGLSICRAICDANEWTVTLMGQERDGRPGVCARVDFGPGWPKTPDSARGN